MIKSPDHYYATLNYVHHNLVRHRYTAKWADWPWSSAADYLAETSPDEARRRWSTYPIDHYGTGWDDPDL